MTPIFCSNKLRNLIGSEKMTLFTNETESYPGGWNGHLFAVDRRKCLAFVNNRSYYAIFIADILKKDLNNFNELFTNRLIQQLLFDKIITLKYIPLIKSIQSSILLAGTNNDKKTIGTMNDFIFQFKVHREYKYENLNQMDVIKENSLINDSLTKPREKSNSIYIRPKAEMKELIETYAQHTV